ncbi:MAG: transcriptional regulator [Bacteroidetes bacterium]|nr:transcriptional regulator [Bacteroidota bacterium]
MAVVRNIKYILSLSLIGFYFLNVAAQPEIELLLKNATTQKDTALINTLNLLASKLKKNNSKQAQLYANNALTQSQKLNYLFGVAQASKTLGNIYSTQGDYNKSLDYSTRSMSIFKQLNEELEIANTHIVIGLTYWRKGDFATSEDNFNAAEKIYTVLNDSDGVAKAWVNIGILNSERGLLNRALEYYLKALRYVETSNTPSLSATIIKNIAIIYSEQENHKTALKYHNQAMHLLLPLNDTNAIANSCFNMGVCYYELEMFDSALVFHRRALESFQAVSNKQGVCESYNSVGTIYHSKNVFDSALIYFNKALELGNGYGYKRAQMLANYNIGSTYNELKEYRKSISFFENGLLLASQMGMQQYIALSNFGLHAAYVGLNDYSKGLAYYKLYAEINDSLFNKESSDKLLSLQVEFETEQKQSQIELLNNELRIKESNIRLVYLAGISIAVFLILVILLIVTRNRKNKQLLQAQVAKANQELEFNKQALIDYAHSLVENQKRVVELTDELKIIGNIKSTDIEKLEKITELTSSKIITEDDWTKFKQLFEKVHGGFFHVYKTKYPDITNAEIRLAALIKLNLNSKEIATMLGISADSVKKTRQRLRKRMNLDIQEELENVILNS